MTLTFKIQLRGIKKPPVWRRIEIPAHFSFHKLHETIQEAFGWWDYHLYQFEGTAFGEDWTVGVPDESDTDWYYEVTDSKKTIVSEFLEKMGLKKFVYVYDFGDNWVHDITLEKVDEQATLTHPICLGGKGACPYEDCGGSWGYEHIKHLFAEDPDGEETKEYREWMGLDEDEEFDPKRFDLDEVNMALESVMEIQKKPSKKTKGEESKKTKGEESKKTKGEESKKTKGKESKKQVAKSVTLLDIVSDLNKGEIVDCADDLHLKIDKRLGIEKMRKAYVKEILANVEMVLCQLPLEDLLILDNLVDGINGPNVVNVYDSYRSYLLVSYGLADEIDDDEDYHYLLFGDDFRDAVAPHIKEILNNDLIKSRIMIENFVEGLANLYGVVSRREVKEMMVRVFDVEDKESAEKMLFTVEQFSALFTWMMFDMEPTKTPADDTMFFISRYSWDLPRELFHMIQNNSFSMEYRLFTKEEIFNACSSPFPIIPNKKQKEFSQMFKDEFGLNKLEISDICHELWYRMMHDGDDMFDETSPEEFFMDLLDACEASQSTRNHALGLLADYLNNIPQWKWKGHTSDEVFKEHPILSKAIQERTDSSRQISGPLNHFGVTMPIITTAKVGRNEPCPCGSGKKYKNCCGRAN